MYNFNKEITKISQKHNPIITNLSNGSLQIQIGQPKTCIISGLHGDERSGPLAILEFLKQDNLQDLLIFPLMNDVGWDNNKREWNDLDLNRSFGLKTAPDFIKEICKISPKYIIDLHEDSETDYPFVYQYIQDSPNLLEQLIYKFDLEMEIWDDGEIWSGSTETYFRSKGIYCITTEVPPTIWPLEKRVNFQVEILNFCINNLFT